MLERDRIHAHASVGPFTRAVDFSSWAAVIPTSIPEPREKDRGSHSLQRHQRDRAQSAAAQPGAPDIKPDEREALAAVDVAAEQVRLVQAERDELSRAKLRPVLTPFVSDYGAAKLPDASATCSKACTSRKRRSTTSARSLDCLAVAPRGCTRVC